MNVFSNAIKFSKPKGKITFAIYEHEDQIHFKVQDYGIGMPEEIKKNLFEIDKPTSRPGTDGEHGTGYGMPILKYFVELFNGEIEVLTKEEYGTKFVLKFPDIRPSQS